VHDADERKGIQPVKKTAPFIAKGTLLEQLENKGPGSWLTVITA